MAQTAILGGGNAAKQTLAMKKPSRLCEVVVEDSINN